MKATGSVTYKADPDASETFQISKAAAVGDPNESASSPPLESETLQRDRLPEGTVKAACGWRAA